MAQTYLLDKLKSVEQTYQELTRRLADPDITSNPNELQRVAKTRASLEETVNTYEEWQKVGEDLLGAKQILKESAGDPEMREMAAMEVEELNNRMQELENRLTILLLPRDPNDEKNIMLEIRSGTGGDEAGIWAGDLVRLYSRYAESQKWKVSLLSESLADMGGFKEAILEITGDNVYSKLKYEAGVHRVQRVPLTEASGRVHTSTATVAIMPEVDDVEVHIINRRESGYSVPRSDRSSKTANGLCRSSGLNSTRSSYRNSKRKFLPCVVLRWEPDRDRRKSAPITTRITVSPITA
jgi:peptide chain release factor 1